MALSFSRLNHQFNGVTHMQYALVGAFPVGGSCNNTSQLSRLTEQLRRIGRWFVDTLNQPGRP
ncbi:protease FtsH-inhibitory lysogeny factor CIII [Pantoea stewartii]|uniref:protease FtsH-inhibitory lysogeny factor CIII n=1 Tax=Pantoea stewartii TaxID=66269 RepID=UPI0019826F39